MHTLPSLVALCLVLTPPKLLLMCRISLSLFTYLFLGNFQRPNAIRHNGHQKAATSGCRRCVNVLERQRLLWAGAQTSAEQFTQLHNGISNTPVYMKINKSVKMNIKCMALLLILKKTNWSLFFFYGIIFYNAVLQLLKNNKLGRQLLLRLLYFTWKEP